MEFYSYKKKSKEYHDNDNVKVLTAYNFSMKAHKIEKINWFILLVHATPT